MTNYESPHVVALCGSLSDDSATRIACRTALDAAAEAGAGTELVDLRAYDLPMFDADEREAGDAPGLKRAVAAADAVVLATPMYHGSYSSPLKTALDYLGREEFEGTTVGLLAVSGGSFPRTALAHLREVCRALDAWTLPLQVGVPDAGSAVADGELVGDDLIQRVRRLGAELVDYAGVERYPDATTDRAQVIAGRTGD